MRSTIAKQFTFHAAHVIPHHQGKCARPHGHTYKVEVLLRGEIQEDGPEAGMVLDFDVVKQIWTDELEPLLDHRDLNETLVASGEIPHSTAEHLARWILMRFQELIGPRAIAVRCWETPTSYAEAM